MKGSRVTWALVAAAGALALLVLAKHRNQRREELSLNPLKAIQELGTSVKNIGKSLGSGLSTVGNKLLGAFDALKTPTTAVAGKGSQLVSDAADDAAIAGRAANAENAAITAADAKSIAELYKVVNPDVQAALAKQVVESGYPAVAIGKVAENLGLGLQQQWLDSVARFLPKVAKEAGSDVMIKGTGAQILQKLKDGLAWIWARKATGFGLLVGAVVLAAQIKAWIEQGTGGGSDGEGGGSDPFNLFGDGSTTWLLWGGGASSCLLLVCMCFAVFAFLIMQQGGGGGNNNAKLF